MKVQLHPHNPLDTSHWPSLELEDDPTTPDSFLRSLRARGPFLLLVTKWKGLPDKPCPELPFSPWHLVWHCFPPTRIHFNLLLLFTSDLVFPLCSHTFSTFFVPFTPFFKVLPSLSSWSSLNCTSGLGAQFLQRKESKENFNTPCVGSALSSTIYSVCLGKLFYWWFLSKELFCLHTKRTHSSWTLGYKLTQIWLIQTSNNYHCFKKIIKPNRENIKIIKRRRKGKEIHYNLNKNRCRAMKQKENKKHEKNSKQRGMLAPF